jgi:hypothetical protein
MLPFHLHLSLLISIFLSGLRTERISLLCHACYIQRPSHSPYSVFLIIFHKQCGLLNFSVRSLQQLLEVQGVLFNENLMLGMLMTSRMSRLGPFWERRMRNAQSSVQAVNSMAFSEIWPPSSPDLSPLCFLWGYSKDNVYRSNP